MMIRKFFFGLVLLSISTFAMAAQHEIAANVIQIKDSSVLNKISKNDATEVFMEIINKGRVAHTVIGAWSPDAAQVQLHTTLHHNGKTYMQQIHGITIPVHQEEDLHLGGLHVMLIGLKKPLSANEIIPVTLLFKDGSWMTINAKVS